MVTRLDILLSWLGLLFYVWQGLALRQRIFRMLPPTQPTSITIKGSGGAKQQPLRILVIGDSTVVGVGVDNFDHSIAGWLPRILVKALDKSVYVKPHGNNSATSAQIRDFVVPHIEREPFDYISLNIGTNDAKNFHSGNRFCRDFGTLIYALKSRFPGAIIIWPGVTDLAHIPALPFPLNKILSVRSRIMSRNGKILCEERGALAPKSKWKPTLDNFSDDGFHASSKGYKEWAEGIAEIIVELEENRTSERRSHKVRIH